MKVTKANLKKSLSNVSNAGGTLRRKRSQKQIICDISTTSSSPVSTLSSTTTAMRSSLTSLTTNSLSSAKQIVKPLGAPPPPPVISKPTSAPPPPPPISMTQSLFIPKEDAVGLGFDSRPMQILPKEESKISNETDDVVKPLEEFKIDLNTESVS